jgi:hypothetical protein
MWSNFGQTDVSRIRKRSHSRRYLFPAWTSFIKVKIATTQVWTPYFKCFYFLFLCFSVAGEWSDDLQPVFTEPGVVTNLLSTWKNPEAVEVWSNVFVDSPTPTDCNFTARVVMLQMKHQRNNSRCSEPVEPSNVWPASVCWLLPSWY